MSPQLDVFAISSVPMYRHTVHLLAQTFFIRDNADDLQHHAHRYDFAIVFYDQINTFVAAASNVGAEDLLVVDLGCLNNLYDHRKIFLHDLLDLLPQNYNYIYLQTERQSNRIELQRRLIEHNCLAYLEKPFTNEYLVEKLFTLFTQRQCDQVSRILYLGQEIEVDYDTLTRENVEWVNLSDLALLNRLMKEIKPSLLLISEEVYAQHHEVAQVIRKNIEFDYSLVIFLLQKQVSEPARLAQVMEEGIDELIPPLSPVLLARYLLNWIRRIRTNKNLINQDRATGLLNKVGYQNAAVDLLKLAARQEISLALCIVDIDKFKDINDTWGHFFGDIVIKRLSLLLGQGALPNDLLGRFGGEEFVLLMWDTQPQEAQARMNALRHAFNQVVFEAKPGLALHFSFSGGIACFPLFSSENELFRQADARLYEAKQGGRNQIRI